MGAHAGVTASRAGTAYGEAGAVRMLLRSLFAQLLRQACPLPVWIKANAGLPVLSAGKTTFPMGPADFAACASPLMAAGATFLGGCCGTTPQHIRALRDVVDNAALR